MYMHKRLLITLISTLAIVSCSTPPIAEPDNNAPHSQSSVSSSSQTSTTTAVSSTPLPPSPPKSVQSSAVSSILSSVSISSVSSSNTGTQQTSFTMEEVAKHSTSSSCYTIVKGNVYDITSYIPYHPGGERNIMKICGSDGSSLFKAQHGGDTRPADELAKLYIGILVP